MKKILITAILVMAMCLPSAVLADGWRLSVYDSVGVVGYNYLGAGSVSGNQFVLDSFQTAAISATAGATVILYTATSDSVITSGANAAGATTIVGTAASSASAFWNTTMASGDLVCKTTANTDPNNSTTVCSSFSSGSTVTGTVKGNNGAIADGTTLVRYEPATANLAFDAPTVSKPIIVFGGDFPPIADFTVTNYSMFPGSGLACPVSEACVFQLYSGATTTSPAIYLRGHYEPYR